jgi:GT2 family glycosyltransferase
LKAQESRQSYGLLVACHNRKFLTLQFIARIEEERASLSPRSLRILLLDDGSVDGTSEAVSQQFPNVKIERADGSLYWNGAMVRLIDSALLEPFAGIILANDDIMLRRGALLETIEAFEELNTSQPTVVVGSFQSEPEGTPSYSGFMRASRWRGPLALKMVPPTGRFEPCDTFNGNWVLVPSDALRDVGGLDPYFKHAFGDIDLGYRLKAAGTRIVVHERSIGYCQKNDVMSVEFLRQRPRRERWSLLFGPHRSPRDYAHFVRKHSPFLAPFLVAKDVIRRIWLVTVAI